MRRPGIVMACSSVGGRVRHTLCSTVGQSQATGMVSRLRSGAGYVTIGVPSRDSAARFYAGTLGFEDRGGGELRARAAVLRLTDPCGKDGTGPASGSVRSVGFCSGSHLTIVPFCHLSCAHASTSTIELPPFLCLTRSGSGPDPARTESAAPSRVIAVTAAAGGRGVRGAWRTAAPPWWSRCARRP